MAVQRCRREPGWSLSQLCLPFRMHFYPQVDCLMATKQAQQLQASCLFQSAVRKKRKSLIKQPSHTVPVASTPTHDFHLYPTGQKRILFTPQPIRGSFLDGMGWGRGEKVQLGRLEGNSGRRDNKNKGGKTQSRTYSSKSYDQLWTMRKHCEEGNHRGWGQRDRLTYITEGSGTWTSVYRQGREILRG